MLLESRNGTQPTARSASRPPKPSRLKTGVPHCTSAKAGTPAANSVCCPEFRRRLLADRLPDTQVGAARVSAVACRRRAGGRRPPPLKVSHVRPLTIVSDVGACTGIDGVKLELLRAVADLGGASTGRAWVAASDVSGFSESAGGGSRFEALLGLARPETTTIRLLDARGHIGGPGGAHADEPEEIGVRLTAAATLVLDAESGRSAPAPVGLIRRSNQVSTVEMGALCTWRATSGCSTDS